MEDLIPNQTSEPLMGSANGRLFRSPLRLIASGLGDEVCSSQTK
jgi:hypothetical protein